MKHEWSRNLKLLGWLDKIIGEWWEPPTVKIVIVASENTFCHSLLTTALNCSCDFRGVFLICVGVGLLWIDNCIHWFINKTVEKVLFLCVHVKSDVITPKKSPVRQHFHWLEQYPSHWILISSPFYSFDFHQTLFLREIKKQNLYYTPYIDK